MNPDEIANLIDLSEDNKLRKEVDDLIKKGQTGAALAKAVDAAEKGETLEPSLKDKLSKAAKKVVGKSKDVLKKMFEDMASNPWIVEYKSNGEWIEHSVHSGELTARKAAEQLTNELEKKGLQPQIRIRHTFGKVSEDVEKFSGEEWSDLENWAKQAISAGSHHFGFDGELFYLADTPGPHSNENDEGVLKWHKVENPDDVMRMAKVIATPEMNPDMCQICQGRGDQAGEWCASCEGRGFQYREADVQAEDIQVQKQKPGNCKTCNMTGWIEAEKRFCPACGGTGNISATPGVDEHAKLDLHNDLKCGTCGEWWPCACMNVNEY